MTTEDILLEALSADPALDASRDDDYPEIYGEPDMPRLAYCTIEHCRWCEADAPAESPGMRLCELCLLARHAGACNPFAVLFAAVLLEGENP